MIFLLTAFCDNKSDLHRDKVALKTGTVAGFTMIYRLLGNPIKSPRFTTAKQIAFALLSRDRRDTE